MEYFNKYFGKADSITNLKLAQLLNIILDADKVKADKSYNGLQVSGKTQVIRVVLGVSICQPLIDKALELKADAIIVHHGLIHQHTVTGIYKNRLKALLENDINLYGYHLSLDTSRTMGHNLHIANLLKLNNKQFINLGGISNLGIKGNLTRALSLEDLIEVINCTLDTKANYIQGHNNNINTIGICAGAGQNFIESISSYRCDTYLSGEISEQTVILARELGINYIYAGHHATERIGIKYLTRCLNRLGLEAIFVDIDNPI